MTHDLRYAFRSAIRQPLTTTLIILVIALTIGLNAISLGVLDAESSRTSVYPEPDRLVDIVRGRHQRLNGPFTTRDYLRLQTATHLFAAVAAYRERSVMLTVGDTTEPRLATDAEPGLLEVLGVKPFWGRTFGQEERDAPVAIISHRLWRSHFGADTMLLDRGLQVDGESRVIVGIMPRFFGFYGSSDIWLPLASTTLGNDDGSTFGAVARLRPEVAIAEAKAELAASFDIDRSRSLEERDSAASRTHSATSAVTLQLVSESDIPLGRLVAGFAFQAAAGFILLAGVANVAGLLLARGMTRLPDIGVRSALGARVLHLVRPWFIEHLGLSLVGAGAGLLVTRWAHDLIRTALPLPASIEVQPLNWRVVGAAFLLATCVAAIAGIGPALAFVRATRRQRLGHITLAAGSQSKLLPSHGRLAFVQATLSFVLLVGATLTIRSFLEIWKVEPGFDAKQVIQVVVPFGANYDEQLRGMATREIISRLEREPEIASVAWFVHPDTAALGPASARLSGAVEPRGGVAAIPAQRRYIAVSDSYFETFGIGVVRGRTFRAEDSRSTSIAVVVNRRAAALMWPDGDALGKQLRFPEAAQELTVIGIVTDVVAVGPQPGEQMESGVSMTPTPTPEIYFAASQFNALPDPLLFVRYDGDRSRLVDRVHGIAESVDPSLQTGGLRTVYEADYETVIAAYGVAARTLVALGLAGLGLSALGAFTALWSSWTQRRGEVGVRLSLGSTRLELIALLLRDSVRLMLSAVVAGAIAAAALYRVLGGFFVGVSYWDPAAYLMVAFVLVTTAVCAGIVPALHFSAADPADVLRNV